MRRRPVALADALATLNMAILEGREDAMAVMQSVSEAIAEKNSRLELVGNDVTSVVPWFRAEIGFLREERFAAIFVDNARRILGKVVFPTGSRTRTIIYPRHLFGKALELNATGVILAHNHPSGTPTMSPADRNLTNIIAKLGEGLEVELVDHIVVCAQSFYSARKEGLL